MDTFRVIVAGGGAAGFFAAIAAAETLGARGEVILCEATAHPLAKVRISGGGRCNVTHACYEPRELVKRYPRGGRELLGPFHRFGPRETIEWFGSRGVALKTESDGRMFPITDDSATIVDCLMRAAETAGVSLRTKTGLSSVQRGVDRPFQVSLSSGETALADKVIIATGGTKGSAGAAVAQAFGHTIEPPVPSLFTFHVDDPRLKDLSGLSIADVATSVVGLPLREQGPMLITHWGLSGPAILKLSAWGARELATVNYRFKLKVNFCAPHTKDSLRSALAAARASKPRKQLASWSPISVPARLWERLLLASGLPLTQTWTQTSNDALTTLATEVVEAEFQVTGKSMNKEEFVTCGGVRLSEVNFQSMTSRLQPGLHFAGEVLDIDGVTGGFNFQAAWTTGWLAGKAAAGVER